MESWKIVSHKQLNNYQSWMTENTHLKIQITSNQKSQNGPNELEWVFLSRLRCKGQSKLWRNCQQILPFCWGVNSLECLKYILRLNEFSFIQKLISILSIWWYYWHPSCLTLECIPNETVFDQFWNETECIDVFLMTNLSFKHAVHYYNLNRFKLVNFFNFWSIFR